MMFEGHTLQAHSDRTPTQASTPPQTVGVWLLPYAWKMSGLIGISITGFALPVFATVPDMQDLTITTAYNCIVIFMRVFGAAGFVGYFVGAYYEAIHFERQWELHAEIQRAKLPGPKPQTVNLTINKPTDTGFHQESRAIVNPPSLDFLTWLWQSASTTGRIPGERAVEAQWGARADPWLDTLTKEGFIEKVGANHNAPRRIVASTAFTEVCARFGYFPTPLAVVSTIAQAPNERAAPHRITAPPAPSAEQEAA